MLAASTPIAGARPKAELAGTEHSEHIERVEHIVPLIIDGKPVLRELDNSRRHALPTGYFQGAEAADCHRAIESSAAAFRSWSRQSPIARRRLLLKLASLLRDRGDEAKSLIREEIHCSELWAEINLQDSIGLIEEYASLLTSPATKGSIPHTESPGSYGLVFSRPLGVVVGIAPWNGPLILGFRSVVAPIAAGNTAIFKGSELSPRTHYFIANLFVEAGFPPGVVNFILHRPQDAPEIVDILVTHPAVRKINFTGSTAVGRIIAQKAGQALKPVLLELGGKNASIVLEDADLARAAEAAVLGATLNSGQICMSTDLVVVVRSVADAFKAQLKLALETVQGATWTVITPQSVVKLDALVADAVSKGATVLASAASDKAAAASRGPQDLPFRVVEDLVPSMRFYAEESFGPMLGLVVVEDEEAAELVVNGSEYALSAAVWSRNHHRALELARRLDAGAVHINAPTVHDEPTLPHGGSKSSGFGRFGADWGLTEFVHTQTVLLHP